MRNLIVVANIALYFALYDPVNVFCGKENCYDLLGLTRDASQKEIRKAFRTISLTQHPDKNKDSNAERFKLISKAYEVLSVNETKTLFDYYLDHPWDYFKVSGHQPQKVAPKTNLAAVIIGFLFLLSFFLRYVQFQKWRKVIIYLTNATLNNLSIKDGGTKQTMELHQRAISLYLEKSRVKKFSSSAQKDPLFKEIVDRVRIFKKMRFDLF